jgi:Tol biopolymer transport system component
MSFKEKRSSQRQLIFPGVLILVVTIACYYEAGVLEPTRTPGTDSDREVPVGAEMDDPEPVQPSCPESPLEGLVFSYRDQNDPLLLQVGTCGEYLQRATQTYVQISPDGNQLLYTSDNDIWLVEILNGDQKNLTNTPDRIEVNPQWWSGNENLVVFGSWGIADDLGPTSGYLSLISTDGDDYWALADEPSNTKPALQPDGSIIAYDLGDTARLYHLDSDESEEFDVSLYGLNILKGKRIVSPSWSPDGKKLTWWVSGVFSPSRDGSTVLAVFDLEKGSVELLHSYTPIGSGGGLPTPIWSPDGNWLAVLTLSEVHKTDLWVISADGNDEHHLGFANNVVWHPDGSTLVFKALSDDIVRLTEVGDWKLQPMDLPPGSAPVDWLDVIPGFSEEGQRSATDTVPSFGPQIYFSADPDPANSQLVFPFGTSEIFAIWPYQHMPEGAIISREWYLDGGIWLIREELWDYAKYGANGVVTDISIYDFDQGLKPGRYQLRLYIDGQEQSLGIGEAFSSAFFEISASLDISPHISPDYSQLAIVEPPGTLIIQDVDSQEERTLLTVDEISSLAWYPNGQFILFSLRDRSGKGALTEPFGFVDELWIVNLETGESYPLQDQFGQDTGTGLHHPYISPDGGYVAAVEGNGWTDACHVASKLWVKEIGFSGDRLYETFSYYQLDFNITPAPENGEMYIKRIIGWDSPTLLKIESGWTCTPDNPDGIYLLDLSNLTAEKIGDPE